jgi:hypothetical protein
MAFSVGIFLLVSVVGLGVASVSLASSPARWKTLKQMALTFAVAFGVGMGFGLLIPIAIATVGRFHPPSPRWESIAGFSTSVALLAAGMMGRLKVIEQKQLARLRQQRSEERA